MTHFCPKDCEHRCHMATSKSLLHRTWSVCHSLASFHPLFCQARGHCHLETSLWPQQAEQQCGRTLVLLLVCRYCIWSVSLCTSLTSFIKRDYKPSAECIKATWPVAWTNRTGLRQSLQKQGLDLSSQTELGTLSWKHLKTLALWPRQDPAGWAMAVNKAVFPVTPGLPLELHSSCESQTLTSLPPKALALLAAFWVATGGLQVYRKALLTMPKSLTVWITINCRKF